MGYVIAFLFHLGAVYVGTQIAQLEYVDFWRSCVVALFSYIAMIILAVILAPLFLVPVLNIFMGSIILGTGTALAAKVVLAIDWRPAWIIGATALVVGLLGSWMLSGCA